MYYLPAPLTSFPHVTVRILGGVQERCGTIVELAETEVYTVKVKI
jgi:hypothetical protein